MSDLPPETIALVASYLRTDRSALYALCLVCRKTRLESLPFLYKTVVLIEQGNADVVPPGCFVLELNKAIRFLATLSQINTSLAGYMRTLFVYFGDYPGSNFQKSLRSSFPLMINLKDLALFGPPLRLVTGDSALVQGCKFHLDSFSCIMIDGRDANMDDLNAALAMQPELNRLLFLCSDHEVLRPDDRHYSKLNHLSGNPATIAAILPSRPITSLTWMPIDYELLEITPALHDKFQDIRTLCIVRPNSHVSLQKVVGQSIYSLQSLETLHIFFWGTPKEFFEMDLTIISKLTSLQIFIQSFPTPIGWSGSGKSLVDSAVDLYHSKVTDWFLSLPHFRTAYFQVADTTDDRCYISWDRGVAEARSVEATEVWGISRWI